MNFGVIGYGYWGPNVVRNLASLPGSQVIAVAVVVLTLSLVVVLAAELGRRRVERRLGV